MRFGIGAMDPWLWLDQTIGSTISDEDQECDDLL